MWSSVLRAHVCPFFRFARLLSHDDDHHNPACSTGGFYIAPKMGDTVDSLKPLPVTWDSSCLKSADINIIQHQVHPFSLEDHSKPGHQRFLTREVRLVTFGMKFRIGLSIWCTRVDACVSDATSDVLFHSQILICSISKFLQPEPFVGWCEFLTKAFN